MMRILILLTALSLCNLHTFAEVDVISEPRPGQEYVFVQTRGSGARPVVRKDKATDAADRPFETAHKVPIALTFRKEEEPAVAIIEGKVKSKQKREANPAKTPIAAPPGSIKIDPKKLIEKYKSELEASTKASSTTTTTVKPSRRSRNGRTRTKKEVPVTVATTPNSILTTGAPPTPRTLHIRDTKSQHVEEKIDASSSENKRSRIQIKKGPNGQEYEYEYVYYYYDDDDEEGAGKDLKSRLSDDVEDADSEDSDGESAVTTEEVGTTEMSAMDKVALDLYAILQGTQKLSGEDESSTDESGVTTTELIDTTDETTTEIVTTEEITTPTTTTTTTTTTTPAPTTTTTQEPVTGRGRFRGRPGAGGNRFKSAPSSTSAPEPSTEKSKSRFSKPGFGSRPRPGARTTTEASEPEATKQESKSVNARPTVGSRNRFAGRGRTPASTTAAPEGSDSTTAASSSAARPGLTRPRPGSFNLRTRGRPTSTTKEPAEGGESPAPDAPEETPSTTAKSIRGRVNGNLARPLRPGARINLATRGRPGAATTTTAAPEGGAENETPVEEAPAEEEEKTGETTPAPITSPLNKLRNRPKINVRPKTAGSAPVQVRRTNPLLARRKPVVNAEPSEAPTEQPQDAGDATEADAEEEAPSEAPSSTTEEPRGLNKLLAGRRRLVRPAATH